MPDVNYLPIGDLERGIVNDDLFVPVSDGENAFALTVGDIRRAATETAFSEEFKNALLAFARNVAYKVPNGQAYYNDLFNALYASQIVDSIVAVYTPIEDTVYTDDNLNVLKPGLVVTAFYADGTSGIVAGYALSGSLQAGSNVITVSYGGKTTTFTITGVVDWYNIFSWSLGDNLEKVSGGGVVDNTTHDLCISHTSAQLAGRRSFVTERGKKEYIDYQTRDGEGFYPIPIPATASKVTVSITPSSQYIAPQTYQLSSSGYYLDEYASWTQGSVALTLTPEENKFLLVSSKYDSAGTSYPTEPSTLTVVFE